MSCVHIIFNLAAYAHTELVLCARTLRERGGGGQQEEQSFLSLSFTFSQRTRNYNARTLRERKNKLVCSVVLAAYVHCRCAYPARMKHNNEIGLLTQAYSLLFLHSRSIRASTSHTRCKNCSTTKSFPPFSQHTRTEEHKLRTPFLSIHKIRTHWYVI